MLFAAREVRSIEEAKRFGVVIPDEPPNQHPVKNSVRWRARGFTEKPQEPPSRIVSTGCIVFPKEVLNVLVQYAGYHPDNMGGILHHLIHGQNMEVDYMLFDAPWFDIGSYEAYLEATQALVPPGKPVIHRTAILDEKSRENLTGSIVIGAGTMVTNSSLEDTILFDHCTVTNCVLERCILDDNCRLNSIDLTGKMLRSGTTLSSPHPPSITSSSFETLNRGPNG